jgi:hypothetical protein
MTTIEILNKSSAQRFYCGNGDLTGVDLQVFSGRAFVGHVRELAQAVRQIAMAVMPAHPAIA